MRALGVFTRVNWFEFKKWLHVEVALYNNLGTVSVLASRY